MRFFQIIIIIIIILFACVCICEFYFLKQFSLFIWILVEFRLTRLQLSLGVVELIFKQI